MNHLPTINFQGICEFSRRGGGWRWTHRTFSSAVSGPSHGSSFEVSTLFESNGSYVHPFYGPNQCNGERGFNGVSLWGVWKNNTEHSKIEDCPQADNKKTCFLKERRGGLKQWRRKQRHLGMIFELKTLSGTQGNYIIENYWNHFYPCYNWDCQNGLLLCSHAPLCEVLHVLPSNLEMFSLK